MGVEVQQRRRHAVRRYVTAVALAGVATLAVAIAFGQGGSHSRPAMAVAFAGLIALAESFPLLFLRSSEGEGLLLSEAFLIPMALLLSPAQVVVAFAAGAATGGLIRRASPIKTAFNVGQLVTSAGLAIGTMYLIDPLEEAGPRLVAAVLAGAIVYFAVNSTLVSRVISLVDGTSFRDVFLGGLGMRALVWGGNVSIGLIAGLVGTAYTWAVPFALVPLAMLQVAFTGHLRARRDRERMNALFGTALDAHASMGLGDVERAITAAARKHLQCRQARVSLEPPGSYELGAPIHLSEGRDRWLVVSDRDTVEPFDAANQQLLEAIAAIASPALENALLYDQMGQERRKLSNVVESSSDGIFSVDNDQRVQSWNPAMERITGFPADEVVGAKCFTVFRPRDVEGRELCVASCPGRCGRHNEALPVQVTTIDGESRWLNCTYSPMPEGGYVVVARDITAQKQVDDLKGDFLATISHELRTPLTPIQGFLQTLLRDDNAFDDSERRRFYEVMLRQSERLERLIKDLLDATSLQDSEHLFVPEEVDWETAATQVVDLFRRQDPEREFELEVQDHLPPVVADAQRAEQVLSNLISNAVKYSGAGAAVRVTIECLGNEVITTVADRGPGIPPADRERVFERFTRLGDHLTRRVGGAGLGLFIARRLVEGMGGAISVDASPEGGAAFTFSLPAYANAAHRR